MAEQGMVMALIQLSLRELHAHSLADLKLDPTALDLLSPETLAALLRRAASFKTPCPDYIIIDAVLDSLKGVTSDSESLKDSLEDLLEALINYGDLLELNDLEKANTGKKRLLYVAPPSFVMRESGQFMLIGGFTDIDDASFTDAYPIELVGHVRRIFAGETKAIARERLLEKGFIELSSRAWLSSPPEESPNELINRFKLNLERQPACLNIPDLLVIGPESSVKYYRGRWTDTRGRTGILVGRRPQTYGAPLWCYVELKGGVTQRFIDLPISSPWRGCDEAWRIQMAIDQVRGKPQIYRVRPGQQGRQILDFFSPIPAWIQRRLDAIGSPNPPSECLISYCIPDAEISEELHYLEVQSWLTRSN